MELNEEPLVKSAAKIFQDLCYNYRDQMSAGIICAGWDRKEGAQVLFQFSIQADYGGLDCCLEAVSHFNVRLHP